MRAVITVVGHDKIGIIYEVSRVLAKNDVNILDISQTIMQDMFTMIMLVSFSTAEISIQEITDKLNAVAEEMGLSIHVQREEIFTSMHRI